VKIDPRKQEELSKGQTNTMNAENHPVDRHQAALQVLDAAHNADPRVCRYGFFSCDDHPFGVGLFHWFSTAAKLLETISDDMVIALAAVDDLEENEDISAELRVLIGSFGKVDELTEAHFEALRPALRGLQDLCWMGTFDELCNSNASWPSELRERFRQGMDEETRSPEIELSAAIAPAEIDDFIEFVRAYGY
jgi:hypothetical protein